MSFSGKGFTLKGLFNTELWPSFPLSSIKNFFTVQWMDGLLIFFFLLLNCIIVYFIYLQSKAAIGFTDLFSLKIFSKLSGWMDF